MKSISIALSTCTALLLAILCGRYFSGHWIFFTFASFQIQGAVLALAGAVLAWLFHRGALQSLLVIASLAVGIHGYIMLGTFRQPLPNNAGAPPLFKLMSFNIMGDNSFENGARIADAMIASNADVIFIQESAPIGPSIDRIKAVYPYRIGCGAQTITCDQSLWSKRPFIKSEAVTASPIYRDRLLIGSVDFNGKPVTFVNVHLTKPYFDNFHQIELARIIEHVNAKEGALILAGDFNASILTPDVRSFLTKTKLMTADNEPQTWPVGAVEAGMAIDHIFVRDPLRFKSLERMPDTIGSNHHGLMAEVMLDDLTASYPPQ